MVAITVLPCTSKVLQLVYCAANLLPDFSRTRGCKGEHTVPTFNPKVMLLIVYLYPNGIAVKKNSVSSHNLLINQRK